MHRDPVPVWVCIADPTLELPARDPGGKPAHAGKGRRLLLLLCHEVLELLRMGLKTRPEPGHRATCLGVWLRTGVLVTLTPRGWEE